MRDLDLTTLRLFVAVCDAGNIARAAARASMVGSAVSKRLTQLEAQLGTQLLARVGIIDRGRIVAEATA